MTAGNTENGISLNLTIEDAKILKHWMGSIVFMSMRHILNLAINWGEVNIVIK